MNSQHTRQIINEIAEEEGLSEKAIRLIVNSQFEGVKRTITAGDPDDVTTFKSVRLNAFGIFRFMPWKYKRFMRQGKSKETYNTEKRKRYDDKR